MSDIKNHSLTIGEVSKRSGVAISTIHFYEAKGLFKSSRTSGNQRRYPKWILRRIAVIRVAQRAGIALSLIKSSLDTIPADRALTSEDWRTFTKSWKIMLDERILSLTQLRNQIDECIGCGCLSLSDCPLRNPDDTLGSQGPGPQLLSHR